MVAFMVVNFVPMASFCLTIIFRWQEAAGKMIGNRRGRPEKRGPGGRRELSSCSRAGLEEPGRNGNVIGGGEGSRPCFSGRHRGCVLSGGSGWLGFTPYFFWRARPQGQSQIAMPIINFSQNSCGLAQKRQTRPRANPAIRGREVPPATK